MHFTPDPKLAEALFVAAYLVFRPGFTQQPVQFLEMFKLPGSLFRCGDHRNLSDPGMGGRNNLEWSGMQFLVQIRPERVEIQAAGVGTHGNVLALASVAGGMITRKQTPPSMPLWCWFLASTRPPW